MGRSKRKKEDVEAFLKELHELSRKHGVYIDGCGCCGSPFLLDRKNYNAGGLFIAGSLKHSKKEYKVHLNEDYFE